MNKGMEHVPNRRSVLGTLRQLLPTRRTSFQEALRTAELQANRFLELLDVESGPVPDDVVLSLPRIERRFHQLRAASGMTYWNGHAWVIGINSSEPQTRQRFTLLHEFKHIVDHGRTDDLYTGSRYVSADRQAEQAADYFAGCVLMPKRMLTKAWYDGMQRVADLARHFEVSERAIEVRLSQLSLRADLAVEQRPDARPRLPQRPAHWYFRSTSFVPTTVEVAPCPT